MTRLRFLLAIVVAFVVLVPAFSPLPAQPAPDVAGKWSFSIVTENGTGTPTVVLKQEGEKLSGTYESSRMGVREIEGTIKGRDVRFVLKGGSSDAPTLTFLGVVVGTNEMHGELDMGGMGSATFTAKRTS